MRGEQAADDRADQATISGRSAWADHGLLVALLLLFLLYGLATWVVLPPLWVRAVYLVVLLQALWAVTERRRHRLVCLALMAPGVIVWGLVGEEALLPLTAGVRTARAISGASTGLSLLFLAALVLRHLFVRRRFGWRGVSSAAAGFLMLGLAWSGLYAAVEALAPGSIRGLSDDERHAHGLLYFSFTTLTTLGYGDVAPVSAAARMLAVLEAVVGQLYLVVILARVVALLPRVDQED